MKKEIPFSNKENEPFIAGTSALQWPHKRLYKIRGAAFLFCREGKGVISADLKTYTLIPDTILILLPNSMVSLTEASPDFVLSYFICSADMLWETSRRLATGFFHFLRSHPCYTFPPDRTGSAEGLLKASAAVYADRDNRFRYQIARNLLHNFLMDTYDKSYRHFHNQVMEGRNRCEELFRKFIDLVHAHCTQQREVTFYAEALCISTKYLTDVCRLTTGNSAKKIIDNFVMLEIKLLLESTEQSLQEIADRLNFPDQSYLGRYFKRHEHISPQEYRKKYTD